MPYSDYWQKPYSLQTRIIVRNIHKRCQECTYYLARQSQAETDCGAELQAAAFHASNKLKSKQKTLGIMPAA